MTAAAAQAFREIGPVRRRMQAVVAVLADGTPYYAPLATVVRDGALVQCHLCGDWYRSVLAHLRVHGWDQHAYREAFGLERSEPLEGDDTRKRRADALRVRRTFDPVVRAGCEAGRQRAFSGELTRAAAAAARGRRQPEQRRRKTLRTLAAISPEARAAGSRRHADERLRRTATEAAARLGHPDIGAVVRDRVAAGHSLARISRDAGLHKDWLCRHLAVVDPDAARFAAAAAPLRPDAPWLPAVRALGFPDVAGYLADRHLDRRHTVATIAAEIGMTHGAVETALARHGLDKVPHAASRARCHDRATAVADRFGFADLDGYLADRRAGGLSWRAIADECGRPPSWVRRRAGLDGRGRR
ncbi:MAG: hypothetical protein QOF00_755 [Pseudonocardiales bacterium]|nr:hypothetical protein [Pseudonocardiales bacterium]